MGKKREKRKESRDNRQTELKAKRCGDEMLRLRISEIGAVFKERGVTRERRGQLHCQG